MSVNKILLIGRIGKDAELKQAGNTSVCNFSLATSETWNDKSGTKQERIEWHQLVVFGRMAESLSKYLTKGKLIFCDGQIRYESYEKDGIKRYATKIVVQNIKFLGGKSEKQEQKPQQKVDTEETPF